MIEVGEIVVCPNPDCKKWIAEVIRPIEFGSKITQECFKPIGNLMQYGEPMTCSRCGFPYYSDGKFHTRQGWK